MLARFYIDPVTGSPHIYNHQVSEMSENKFPAGWDENRVQRVLAHYEGQTEDDGATEDETAIESCETVMNVPRDLVPKVRELIAKRQKHQS